MHLLVEREPPKLHLHLVDFLGLGSRHRSEKARHRVERTIRVIAGKWILMRPFVAHVTQLEHQVAVRPAELGAEGPFPAVGHDPQEERRVVH